MYIRMTYSVVRWYHLWKKKKQNLWNTYFHLSNSHCLSAPAVFADLKCYHQINSLLQNHGSFSTWQYFYFSSWLFPTWISASSGAWLHISVRLNALHIKLSIYPWIQVEFTSESCLDSLMIPSLGCGNLDPGETCPNQGPANTTPTCWISFI